MRTAIIFAAICFSFPTRADTTFLKCAGTGSFYGEPDLTFDSNVSVAITPNFVQIELSETPLSVYRFTDTNISARGATGGAMAKFYYDVEFNRIDGLATISEYTSSQKSISKPRALVIEILGDRYALAITYKLRCKVEERQF